MKTVINCATYPGRQQKFEICIARLASLADVVNVVLNDYDKVPAFLKKYKNVNPIIPPEDLKDVGKFLPQVDPDDYVFLCDDDIIYPENYVSVLMRYYKKFEHLNPVIGVHGMIYSDFFDGDISARLVFSFTRQNVKNRLVNQLGTGTVLVRGHQMPAFDFMLGSGRFVDVRFARHAKIAEYPMICIPREEDWMTEVAGPDDSLYTHFTQSWPNAVVKECLEIAGFAKINAALIPSIEMEEIGT